MDLAAKICQSGQQRIVMASGAQRQLCPCIYLVLAVAPGNFVFVIVAADFAPVTADIEAGYAFISVTTDFVFTAATNDFASVAADYHFALAAAADDFGFAVVVTDFATAGFASVAADLMADYDIISATAADIFVSATAYFGFAAAMDGSVSVAVDCDSAADNFDFAADYDVISVAFIIGFVTSDLRRPTSPLLPRTTSSSPPPSWTISLRLRHLRHAWLKV
jgi:hypothetical protein